MPRNTSTITSDGPNNPNNPNEDDPVPSPTFKGALDHFIYDSPPKNGALRSLKRKLSASSSDHADTTSTTRITRSTTSRAASLSAPSLLPASRSRPPSTSPRKRHGSSRQTPTPTTPPTTGPISHLRDTIPPGLILLFIGVNPGIMTGQTGHVYAHPSNLYWKLLHSSGITARRHPPSDTYRLPELYSVGNTNIVTRPTRDASQLSRREMDEGVPVLERKIAEKRPEAVCLVGKSIWEAVWRVKMGRGIRKGEFRYGWQDEGNNMGRVEGWEGARVFVATTTSGLAAGMSMQEKEAVWKELGEWVVEKRRERAEGGGGASGSGNGNGVEGTVMAAATATAVVKDEEGNGDGVVVKAEEAEEVKEEEDYMDFECDCFYH
ncbi:hypothetical protein FQN50_007440 [Emmonsiellopsis sp. PD_5]|nr:hypothetical protein FQN50_007440 [Emmonsiellopsis sp. PD_5]